MKRAALLIAIMGVGLGVGAYFLLDWQYGQGKEAQASSADLQVLLCEDAIKRRPATEQNLTRIFTEPASDAGRYLGALPLSAFTDEGDRPSRIFKEEWDQLQDILAEAAFDIDAYCLPSHSAVTAREERL